MGSLFYVATHRTDEPEIMRSENNHAFGIPDLAMILTTVCWGFNFVITKSAAGNDPGQIKIFIYNVVRFALSSGLLFLTLRIRGIDPTISRKDIKAVAGLSFVGIFLYQILYMVGQTLTSATNIGVIYSFMPLLIVVVSMAARIERPTVFTILGVLTGCAGLVMILFKGGRLSLDFGSVLFVLACLCFASYAVFGKPVLDRIPPVTLMAWILLFGTLYQIPLALWQVPMQSWTTITGQNVLYMFLAAILSQYVGYTLFYYSISRLGPSKSGIYSNLTPFFTLVFAVIMRGEQILPVHIAGFLAIVTGIGITKISFGTSGR